MVGRRINKTNDRGGGREGVVAICTRATITRVLGRIYGSGCNATHRAEEEEEEENRASVAANVSSLASESSLDPRKQKVQEESSQRIQCRKLSSAQPSDKLRHRIPIFVAVLALILQLWRISLSPCLSLPLSSFRNISLDRIRMGSLSGPF